MNPILDAIEKEILGTLLHLLHDNKSRKIICKV